MGSSDNRIDFERASRLAGVEPTLTRRIGEPNKIGRPWKYDTWDYRPGGGDITAQINSALAIAEPRSEFASYVRTLYGAELMIVAETIEQQAFTISRGAIARLEALGADVCGDFYWKGAPDDSEAVADIDLAFSVDGTTLATDPAMPFDQTSDHLERRVEAFSGRAAHEMAASATGVRELTINLVERGGYQGSCWLTLDPGAIAAIARLSADVVINLSFRPLSSRA